MKTALRAAAAATLAAAIQAGCVQADQGTTLFPDGSGKLVVKLAIKKSFLKMMEAAARQRGPDDPPIPENPLEQFTSPDRLAESAEGFAAWKIGPREEDAEWVRVALEGYFEDINQARLYDTKTDPDGRERRVVSYSWRYERSGKGGTLTLNSIATDAFKELDNVSGKVAKDDLGKAMLETLKPMFQDFRATVGVTVPGPVRDASGFTDRRDRTATILMDGSLLLGAVAGPDGEEARKLRAIRGARVSWADTAVSDAELAAFKKELAEAREAWSRKRGLPAASKPAAPARKSLGDDADRFSDDEVNRAFVRAQIKTAKVYIDSGKANQARDILEDVIKNYGKLKEAEEARALLEKLK
jgi:FimV-like protein